MKTVSRSYNQFCALALALDRVGERWALLVIRELLTGPRRFADLLEGLPGVATNTLTSRLDELESGGLIVRRRLPPPAGSSVYELTARGRELEPVVLAFARWGEGEIRALSAGTRRALAPPRSNWLGLALKAYFAPNPAKVAGRLQLRLPTGELGLAVKNGALEVVYGALSEPEATLGRTKPWSSLCSPGSSRSRTRCGAARPGSKETRPQPRACWPAFPWGDSAPPASVPTRGARSLFVCGGARAAALQHKGRSPARDED